MGGESYAPLQRDVSDWREWDSLEFISTKPESPAVLPVGEELYIRIRYNIASVQRAHIWTSEYTNGQPTPHTASSGAPMYYAGSGVAESDVSLSRLGKIDEIRAIMAPDTHNSEPIATAVLKVNLEWK